MRKEIRGLARTASRLLSCLDKMKMGFRIMIDPDHPSRPAVPGDAFAPQPLSGLPVGGRGRVLSVDVSAVDLERLEVMGLCAGRMVRVIKDGDPMIVGVLGTRIGLAAALAARVHLRPETSPSSAPTEA